MSLRIAAFGVIAAAGLAWVAAADLHPVLALATDAQPTPAAADDAPSAPVDLTPPYVGPESLAALKAQASPAAVAPDPLDVQVRRELAQSESELRASELELAAFSRAAADRAAAAPDPPSGSSGQPAAQPDTPQPILVSSSPGEGW